MINLLIANSNLRNLLNLQNYISQYIPEIRVGYITSNGRVALEAIKNQHFDALLMDAKLPEINGIDILKQLSIENEIEFNNSIIILADSPTLVKTVKKNEMVYDALSNTETLSAIIHTLKNFVNLHKEKSKFSCIRSKIINELQLIGFNLSHKGTHYLAESILLVSASPKDNENLSKNIYPKVSKIFNKNLNNIKCNITSATEAACKNITPEILSNYFKLSTTIKPTTKMIIYSILQRL